MSAEMQLPRPLEQMIEEARRDDWHTVFVGSDIRVLLARISELEADKDELETENEKLHDRVMILDTETQNLKAIVEEFPKTADGVYVTPHMDIFCPKGHKAGIVDLVDSVAMCIEDDCRLTWMENGLEVSDWSCYDLSECYSTQEASKLKGLK